jgi:hypothetical protein
MARFARADQPQHPVAAVDAGGEHPRRRIDRGGRRRRLRDPGQPDRDRRCRAQAADVCRHDFILCGAARRHMTDS